MVVDCPLVITSEVKPFFRPDKTRKEKWLVQPVFCIVDTGSCLIKESFSHFVHLVNCAGSLSVHHGTFEGHHWSYCDTEEACWCARSFLSFLFLIFCYFCQWRTKGQPENRSKCFASNTHKNQYQCSGLVFASSVVKSANNLDLQILELMIRLSFSSHNHFNSSCYDSTTHRKSPDKSSLQTLPTSQLLKYDPSN